MLILHNNQASFNYPLNMILLKIDNNGQLEWNDEEIRELARMYDRGCLNDETVKAKIIELIWRKGYEEAMENITHANQTAMLLFGEVAGNA